MLVGELNRCGLDLYLQVCWDLFWGQQYRIFEISMSKISTVYEFAKFVIAFDQKGRLVCYGKYPDIKNEILKKSHFKYTVFYRGCGVGFRGGRIPKHLF